jgi:hypothetical protein
VSGTTVTLLAAGDCTVRASQAGGANWNAATPVDRTVTVAKASQAITFAQPAARTYGDLAFEVTATGGGSSNPVTFSSLTTSVCTVSGALVTIVGAGDCTIRASQDGDTNWSAATPVSRTFAVSRATPGISVTGGIFDFTGLPHAGSGFAYGLGGIGEVLAPAVTLSYSGTGSTVYGPSAAAPTAGGEYRVTATFAGNTNYLGGSSFAPLTIGLAPQAITFGALAGRTYGNPPFAVSATGGGSGNPVTFSTLTTSVCTVSGATVTIVGAGTCTIDADQAGNGSYSAAPQAHANVVVAPATLTVTAVDKVITYGSPDPSFTFTYGGLVGSDGAGVIDTPPTCTVSGPHASVVGSPYTIACSGGVDDDYTFSYVNGALTVAPATQAALSVVVGSQATYGTTSTLSATGGTGSGAVTFSAGASTACSVAGTTLSITSGTGTCAVTATKAADANHSPISSVASVTVARAAPTISLTASVGTYEANVPVTFTASVQAVAAGATPTGVVTFRVTGLPDTAMALAAGGAADTLTFATVGPKAVIADFAGDANYGPATASIAPTVVANIVNAAGVGASGSTIYPVKDAWKDTVAIRGTRNERISVAIAVYSPTGSRVRSTSLPAGTGAYGYTWNGRSSSGAILAAGRYRVVQVLTDAYGARKTYTSYVTLSRKRMSWYTKVLTVSAGPRNYQVRSTSDARWLSAPSTTSSGPLGMSNATTAPAWIAAGYQFTLPSASTYRSLSFEVRGSWTGTTAPRIGLIPWDGGDWGSVYSLVRPRVAVGTSPTTFYRHAVTNLAGIRSGRTVRAAIDSFAAPGGHAVGPYRYSITTVRLVVRYGILD